MGLDLARDRREGVGGYGVSEREVWSWVCVITRGLLPAGTPGKRGLGRDLPI